MVCPGWLFLMGDREEIRHFQDAVRAGIEHAAPDAGRRVGDIPAGDLLALVCAIAFSAVLESAGMAGAAGSSMLPAGGVLEALISDAVGSMRARYGQPLSRDDLAREIYWRMRRVLAAGDEHAAALRAEIAMVLERTDALGSALLAAIEAGNDQLRSDVLAAIGVLSSGFAEMAFLVRAGDHGAAEAQRRLDGQGAQVQALSEMVRRQSADVRMAREDLAAMSPRQVAASRDVGRADGGPRWAAGCPYLGLHPFDQAHTAVFCGRQRLTAELMVKLAGRLAGPAMVVVSGASGAGKSSLLHAGLLPTLSAGIQLEGSDNWPCVVMTPGDDPLAELATRLAALSGGDTAVIRHTLAADPDRAHLVVGQTVLAGTARRGGAPQPASGQPARLVLVVDQFEEVFTLSSASDDGGQKAFIAALCAAAGQPFGPRGKPPALVVVAVRGDYWARCAAHAGLARVMQDGLFVVGPMTGSELREAITGPAAAAGLQVDANLADVILSDLRAAGHEEAGGILPLLSQAMMLTWGKREGSRLTVHGYNQTGGVARCVEFGAETAYQALPDAGQQVAREIFQALVLVSPDSQLARRSVRRADLCADRRGTARGTVDNVLEAFASGRLLVLDGDTVQIAHDVLLRAWPRLRGWLESDQANWVLHSQLQEDAARWAEHHGDSSFLYRGSQLAAVQHAAARWTADPARFPALTQDQSGFLAASGQDATRGARVRRAAVLALAVLLVISVAGVAIATQSNRTATQQRNAAVSNQLAVQSEALDATNPVTAAALATAAWKIDPTPEARTSLLDVLAQPQRGTITAASGNITAIAFSPDGKRFATATDSGVTQIWDMATRHEIGKPLTIKQGDSSGVGSIYFGRDDTAMTLYGGADGPSQFYNISARRAIGPSFHIAGDQFNWATFSPDGKVVAIGGATSTAGILDVATHSQVGPLIDEAQPLTFSPDGKLLAVNDLSNPGVRVMDVATRDTIGAPIPAGTFQSGAVAAFSPDGKVLAVNGANSVNFWDIARHSTIGTPIAVRAGNLAFSPNGKFLATVSPAGTTSSAATVNLWDVASHQELGGTLTVETNLNTMAFSPDSTTLATSDGAVVSFWDVAISRQVAATLHGAGGPVAFSPNGQVLAALTNVGPGTWNAGIWSARTHHELGNIIDFGSKSGDRAAAVAFSPDGKILAVGGQPNIGTQLWDVATRRRIETLRVRSDSEIGALAFSPDGKYLAIGGAGYTWLWDINKHRAVGRPMPNTGGLNSAAFSPDGRILAFADGVQVELFSVATQSKIGVLRPGGPGSANGIAFSPDGSMIATAGSTGVILWEMANRHQIGVPLDVGVGPVQVLAFSPDGALLAAGGEDGAVRLWDVASHEQVGSPLVVDRDSVSGIAFSPDGTILAVANSRATRIWGVALTKDALNRVCAVAGGSMSQQLWSSYVKSVPFQQTCA